MTLTFVAPQVNTIARCAIGGYPSCRVTETDAANSRISSSTVVGSHLRYAGVFGSNVERSVVINGAEIWGSLVADTTLTGEVTVLHAKLHDAYVDADHPVHYLITKPTHRELGEVPMYAYSNRPEEGQEPEMTVVVGGHQFRGPNAVDDIERNFLGADAPRISVSQGSIRRGVTALIGIAPAPFGR